MVTWYFEHNSYAYKHYHEHSTERTLALVDESVILCRNLRVAGRSQGYAPATGLSKGGMLYEYDFNSRSLTPQYCLRFSRCLQ